MQKIMIFSNMYPTQKHPTYGIFVKNQVELLRSKGLDVEIIAITDPAKGKFSNLKKYLLWFMRSMMHMMGDKRRTTLTHAHYAFPTGVLSLIGKKLFRLPYVVTVHGGDIDKMAAKNERIRSATQKILQGADAVIVVGERLKKDVIERFGVDQRRVHVMSMGVNTEVFKPMPKSEARQELSIPENEKTLLYVGNMIEAKGVLELVDAFKIIQEKYPDAKLHMIGSDKDEAFMHIFAKHLLDNDVRIIHHLPMPQREIAKWIAAADVFVLPSHHEGFGLVALEAMSVGTSVVGTDVGGLSYLLSDGAGILVEPKNPESLAEGLIQALSEPEDKRSGVMQRTAENHSYEVIAKRLMTIYEEIEKNRKKKS